MTKEKRETAAHHMMAVAGGFFGIYALTIRSETFGSSETSNLIYLVLSGLTGSWQDFLIRLGATVCYIAGIAFAAVGRQLCRDFRLWAIGVDAFTCLLLAWIPAGTEPVLALYPMFFATAVQWLAYTEAAGFSSATIFSTNNLRQCTEGLVGYICTQDRRQLSKFRFYGGTLLCFHGGVAYGWLCLGRWGIASILACLPLLALGLAATLRDRDGARR